MSLSPSSNAYTYFALCRRAGPVACPLVLGIWIVIVVLLHRSVVAYAVVDG